MGFPLPDELSGSIFNHLDVPSLLRCMQVCKLFHSIISGSTHLVYKTELFASHMEDNEHSSMDTVSRLNLLREYNRSWNNTEWTPSESNLMSHGYWVFSGGILVQAFRENTLSLVQLPCKLKGIPERRWTVPFDIGFCHFTLDSSQGLIVLLEVVGTFPNMSCNIHLRTLSGEQHPRTAVTQITHPLMDLYDSEFSCLIQIYESRLAILFDEGVGPENTFLVWDWQTGERELFIRTAEIRSYAFMTEGLVLAAILRSDSEPTLQVLRIAVCVGPIYSLEDIPCVCELQFPKVQITGYFVIQSGPTTTWNPPACSGAPFYSSGKDFIFTIAFDTVADETGENIALFVTLSTLLLEVERSHDVPRRNVPWDAWGRNGTHMVPTEPGVSSVCHTYGMKFIQMPSGSGHAVRVYDFNPYAAKKYVRTSADSAMPWRRLVEGSQPSGLHGFYDPGQVDTGLPGRVATVTLELHPGPNAALNAALIGEDHIVVVQPLSNKYHYIAI